MASVTDHNLDRRELLTRTVPACAIACLGLGRLPAMLAPGKPLDPQDQHKWDIPQDLSLSVRERTRTQYREYMEFIKTLQGQMEEPELIELLNQHSAAKGRQIGERQAQDSPDTEFATFVNQYRPPRYSTQLTHGVVGDSEEALAYTSRSASGPRCSAKPVSAERLDTLPSATWTTTGPRRPIRTSRWTGPIR